MDKRFMIILGGVVAAMIGLFVIGGEKESSDVAFTGDPTQVQEGEKTQGPTDAKVTLIEYADFQCPGCAAIAPALDEVKQEFGTQILFVFRHFPLTNIHPNAMAAHRAAEAARAQGKFWEMHDYLFQRQQVWTGSSNAPQVFESYAEELGLDVEQYKSDAASQTALDAIQIDRDSGSQLSVNATPTLLLNGQKIDTPRTADELKAKIQEAIDAASN